MYFVDCWIMIWWYLIYAAIPAISNTDVGLSVPESIRKAGYPVEVYTNVATTDRYLLDVFRIPHGQNHALKNSSKPVVFLMHGLMGNSRDYVLFGPERGLAYLLADRNYDVWLGNARGTAYSRKHQVLNPDIHQRYWQFSWHEIGVYDLPAMFDLVKNVTNQDQISYVGVSQGTTVYYVLMSERPEYNRFINVMVSLAPVAYMKYVYSPLIRLLAKYEPFWTPLAKITGINELPPKPLNRLLGLLAQTLCRDNSILVDVCARILFVTGGYDYAQLNKSTLYLIFSEGSGGSSTRQALHYAQNINSGQFRNYNFGRKTNMRKYGSNQPPAYNINNIVSPVALFHAEKDWFAQPKDVDRLYRELPNCISKYKIPFSQFNHYDFLFANDVVELVYDEVFKIMEKFNKNVT